MQPSILEDFVDMSSSVESARTCTLHLNGARSNAEALPPKPFVSKNTSKDSSSAISNTAWDGGHESVAQELPAKTAAAPAAGGAAILAKLRYFLGTLSCMTTAMAFLSEFPNILTIQGTKRG